MRYDLAGCLLLAILGGCAEARAQSAAPFSEIEFSASGVVLGTSGAFSEHWAPGPGAAITARTPFYLGDVSGSLAVVPVAAREGAEVPSFLSLAVTGGWGARVPLPGAVRLEPSVFSGLYWMHFLVPSGSWNYVNEAELMVGVRLRTSLGIGAGWRVAASAAQARVFTHRPIDLRSFEIGVSRTISTPAWLRRVLK